MPISVFFLEYKLYSKIFIEVSIFKVCNYAATGRRCYQQLFYQTCPGIAAAAYYGCESFRQYVLAEYPQCIQYCEGKEIYCLNNFN